jgi:hypothetical protein
MSKAQTWFLLVVLLLGVLGGFWIGLKFYQLSERRAWTECIREKDQTSAQNLVCRSQYPGPYQHFVKEFKGEPD